MESPVLTEGSWLACIAGSSPCSVRSEAQCTIQGAGTRIILADMAKPGVHFTNFGTCKISGGPCVPALVDETWYPAAASSQVSDRAPAALAASQLFCTVGGVIFVETALATTIMLRAEGEALVDDTSPLDGDGDFSAEELAKLFFDPSSFLDWLGLIPGGGWLLKAIRSGSKINKARKLIERVKKIREAIERALEMSRLRRLQKVVKPRPKADFRPGSRKHNQMMGPKRGGPWDSAKIDRTFDKGKQFSTSNSSNGNPATRYVDPVSKDFIVVDDVTGDIVMFGNKNMIPTDRP
jgi:hypothetical protein